MFCVHSFGELIRQHPYYLVEDFHLQTTSRPSKLVSLLVVFLSENFETGTGPCQECGSTLYDFGKSFLIGGKWICMSCVISRMIQP